MPPITIKTSLKLITRAWRSTILASNSSAAWLGSPGTMRRIGSTALEEVLHRRAGRVDVLDQPVPVELQPVVEDRADRGEADGAAEIARQIVEPGGVLQLVGRRCPVRSDWPAESRTSARYRAPPAARTARKARLVGQQRVQIDRDHEQRHADRQHDAQIELARQMLVSGDTSIWASPVTTTVSPICRLL